MSISDYPSIRGLSGINVDAVEEVQAFSSQFLKTKALLKEQPEYRAYQVAKKQMEQLLTAFPKDTMRFMREDEKEPTQASWIAIKSLRFVSSDKYFLSEGIFSEEKASEIREELNRRFAGLTRISAYQEHAQIKQRLKDLFLGIEIEEFLPLIDPSLHSKIKEWKMASQAQKMIEHVASLWKFVT